MHVKRNVCDMLFHGPLLRVRLSPLLGWAMNSQYTTQVLGRSILTVTERFKETACDVCCASTLFLVIQFEAYHN